jgi:hypothetical protein
VRVVWTVAFLMLAATAAFCGDAPVLIEIGMDSNFETGMPSVTPRAPKLQILRTGEVRFSRDGEYREGRLTDAAIARLSRSLERNRLLQSSRFIQLNHGQIMAPHGGTWWIRYIRADGEEILLVTAVIPRYGRLASLASELRSQIPARYWTFVPQRMSVSVRKGYYDAKTAWPFAETFSLVRAAADTHKIAIGDSTWDAPREQELTDPRIIAFINAHANETDFREGDASWSIYVASAPGWFPPSETCMRVLTMRMEND